MMDNSEILEYIGKFVDGMIVGAHDPNCFGERVKVEISVMSACHLVTLLGKDAAENSDNKGLITAILREIIDIAPPTAKHMLEVRKAKGATNMPLSDFLNASRKDKQDGEDTFVKAMREVFLKDQSGESDS